MNDLERFGLKKPTIDFEEVRDNRRSMPLWLDVDLTTARSIAAGTAMSINIAGNSFYVDADTSATGNATVHFQDTNLGNASAPIFVSPGAICNVPFTQILIENTAQSGKRLRIFYGVDIDFQAGVNASLTVTGNMTVSNPEGNPGYVSDSGYLLGASYKSTSVMASNTADMVFSPAANTGGAIVWAAGCSDTQTTGGFPVLIAKSSAPANVLDGDVIAIPTAFFPGAQNAVCLALTKPVKIPAGKGLYYIHNAVNLGSIRFVNYKLL